MELTKFIIGTVFVFSCIYALGALFSFLGVPGLFGILLILVLIITLYRWFDGKDPL